MLLHDLRTRLLDGMVIPAHPLALDPRRRLDERRQAALTRYYRTAGAGGVAVGVHTTQFAIRDPNVGLLEPVLAIAADVAHEDANTLVLVAGICGDTRQARREAELASRLRYDAGLVSLAALKGASHEQLVAHCRAIAEIIPVFGFYLQPAVGGVPLDYEFWRAFFDIPRSWRPRWHRSTGTRRSMSCGRWPKAADRHEIALYTGNDDNIVPDLARGVSHRHDERTAVAPFRGRTSGSMGGVDKARGRAAGGSQGRVARSRATAPTRYSRRLPR